MTRPSWADPIKMRQFPSRRTVNVLIDTSLHFVYHFADIEPSERASRRCSNIVEIVEKEICSDLGRLM
jgi:hypothetical protein